MDRYKSMDGRECLPTFRPSRMGMRFATLVMSIALSAPSLPACVKKTAEEFLRDNSRFQMLLVNC